MRSGNLSGHLTLFTDRGAIDVAQASGGRFSADPQAPLSALGSPQVASQGALMCRKCT